MELYFDKATNTFSLERSETNEKIFESFECHNYRGHNKPFSCGLFRINVFWAKKSFKSGNEQWLGFDVYVQDAHLLPLSLSYRETGSGHLLSTQQISFHQLGPGHNVGNPAHTYLQRGQDVDWVIALQKLIEICNNYKNWQIQETNVLVEKLLNRNRTGFSDISNFLCLVESYKTSIPELYDCYRLYVDKYCFDGFINLIECIKTSMGPKDSQKKYLAESGECLWNYIKNNYLMF